MLTKSTLRTRKKKALAVESLESRLNLSGLAGHLALLHHDGQSARLSAGSLQATLNKSKPLSVSLASAADVPVDTTSVFGDTTISSSSATNVAVTDYSNISGARIEYRSANPNIGYMSTSGATIDYKVNVAVAGSYQVSLGVASALGWSSTDLSVNGTTSAQYSFIGTGSWDAYKTITQNVWLNAGSNTLRLTPTWGSQFNLNAITLTPNNPTTNSTQAPAIATNAGNVVTLGTSAAITADKYTSIYNSKVEYVSSAPDIGYVSTSGAYVEYTLNVQQAGNYVIAPSAASPNWSTFDLSVNGTQAANYVLNSTGSYQNYVPVTNTVYLSAGTNVLRFSSKWGTQYNLGTLNIWQAGSSTSNTAPATTTPATPAAPTTPSTPSNSGAPVNISSSWMTSFNQLNVTGGSADDSIYVSQSGDTLYVNANGVTTSYSASSYGDLVVKGGDGNDSITIDSSVKIDTLIYGQGGNDTLVNKTQGHGTIVAVGGGYDTLTGNGWNTSFWADSSDAFNASSNEINGGHVHQISGFYGGVSTELQGQDLADPAGTGTTTRLTSSSLWGTGPTMSDVAQGQVSDCFLLGPLQTLAFTNPDRLREMAVDLGDGTFAVQFKRGGTSAYVRVDGDLPAGGWYANGLNYAHPGASGNEWLPILEKAYAIYRTGAWNYNSLAWGNFNAVLSDFGVSVSGLYGDANTLFSQIQGAVASGKGVTIGTNASINSGAPLIGSHTYTVTSAWRDSSGTGYVTLRNPWGFDGAGNDGNSGDALVTMNMYQLQSNMQAGSIIV